MADLIQGYLEEVRSTLDPTMDAGDLTAILNETEQHLRDRVSALQELGLPLEDAQAGAIADFGPSDSYAGQMSTAHELVSARAHRRVLMLPSVLGIYLLLLAELTSTLPRFVINPTTTYVLGFGTVIAFWVALIATSFRSRRFVPLPLLAIAATIGMLCWVVMSCTHLNLSTTGGLGSTARWDVGLNLKEWHDMVKYSPANAGFAEQNIAATKAALERGVLFQFSSGSTYFINSAGPLLVISLSGNLIGTFLSRLSRARTTRRTARA